MVGSGIARMVCWAGHALILVGLLSSAWAGLFEYVQAPDDTYRWEVRNELEYQGDRIYELRLYSQTWQGIEWSHILGVYAPAQPRYTDTALLFIVGGSTNSRLGAGDLMFAYQLSQATGSVVAILAQVPNQPLFGGRKEDDLIAHTLERYLETKDDTWPLLFPMTKSAVRAMDAVQEFSDQRLGRRIERFVVSGGSKRGWTSWLTAAVDPRVAATAPMVIDMLNIPVQMAHQLEVWGEYSKQIEDYTKRNIPQRLNIPEVAEAVRMVDPYTYRERYTMPKLIVIGTNDDYWVLDALNLYWDDLPEPKHILYVPNSGHGLEDRKRATAGLGGYFRFVASRTPLPKLDWRFSEAEDRITLEVSTTPEPVAARLWVATSEDRDFRDARWEERPMEPSEASFRAVVPRQEGAYVAAFGELEFAIDEMRCPLSTQVHIAPPMR